MVLNIVGQYESMNLFEPGNYLLIIIGTRKRGYIIIEKTKASASNRHFKKQIRINPYYTLLVTMILHQCTKIISNRIKKEFIKLHNSFYIDLFLQFLKRNCHK